MKEEQKILQYLQMRQKEYLNQVTERCVTPILKRIVQENDIDSSDWRQKQIEMRRIVSKELLQKNEESIDWLRTRQELFLKFSPHNEHTTKCSLKI